MRDKSYEMWKDNKGITNREIAKTLGIDEKKVATWKTRDNWNGDKKECSTTKKDKKKKCSTTKSDVAEKKGISEKEINKVLDDSLTEKQRLFCIYYIQSFNATQSAIKAGYSKDSAYAIGSENLSKPVIKEFLSTLKANYMVDDYLEGKRLLDRHKQIAFADMKDYVDSEGCVSGLSYVDGTLIKKVTFKQKDSPFGTDTSTSIELEDRSKSLDFLSKFYGIDARLELEKAKFELEKEKYNKDEDEENNDTTIQVELV